MKRLSLLDRWLGTKQFMESENNKKDGISVRKVMPHEKVIGGGVGAYPWTTIQHPDGSYENVRDLEKEAADAVRVNAENERRSNLIRAMRTRVVSESELNAVLELGSDIMKQDRTAGFYMVTKSDKEYDRMFLNLLSIQAAIRKLQPDSARAALQDSREGK